MHSSLQSCVLSWKIFSWFVMMWLHSSVFLVCVLHKSAGTVWFPLLNDQTTLTIILQKSTLSSARAHVGSSSAAAPKSIKSVVFLIGSTAPPVTQSKPTNQRTQKKRSCRKLNLKWRDKKEKNETKSERLFHFFVFVVSNSPFATNRTKPHGGELFER